VESIREANARDLERGRSQGLSGAMLDRLDMGPKAVEATARGVDHIASLPDPVGSRSSMQRLENGLLDWAFVNINIRPYYAEGSKTLAFETAEQLGWRAPDQVVVPMASGSLLTKIWKGLKEFEKLGLVDSVNTKVNGAQAEGCSPIATAYRNGQDFFKPVKPHTIAKSLAIGNPADGYYALKTVAESQGAMDAVTDEEIVESIKLLAQTEGIFAETAGGVTIGVLRKLVKQGRIQKNDVTVAYITGNGLKTQEAVVDSVGRPFRIPPSLSHFIKTFAIEESA
jgi:threonine synthase